jgi:hypothetical protein
MIASTFIDWLIALLSVDDRRSTAACLIVGTDGRAVMSWVIVIAA